VYVDIHVAGKFEGIDGVEVPGIGMAILRVLSSSCRGTNRDCLMNRAKDADDHGFEGYS